MTAQDAVVHEDAAVAVELKAERVPHGDDAANVAFAAHATLAAAGVAEYGVVELSTSRDHHLLTRVTAWSRDEGTGSIGLNRYQLQALKVGLGETITLRRVDVGEARRLVLEPLAPLLGSAEAYEQELRGGFAEIAQLAQVGMLVSAKLADFRRNVLLRVLDVTPELAVVTPQTRVVLRTSMLPPGVTANLVTFDDVGGLQAEIEQIRELVECPLVFPRVYDQLGIQPARGLLLHGPPGVGKTHLVRAIANEVGAHFVYINGPEIVSSVQGGTEANLRRVFEEAMENSPAVVMIDEIDAIGVQRKDSGTAEARMGTQLLTLLDGLVNMEDVVVIGTTNRVNVLDPALRRPGRLDREIAMGPPDVAGRLDILGIHTRRVPLTAAAAEYLPEIARTTHGYTGADLVELVREAGLKALRRLLGPGFRGMRDPEAAIEGCSVDREDLIYALEQTRPSALREAVVSHSGVGWGDIGGLAPIIDLLREMIEMPLLHPDSFADVGLRPSRGVLLHGPPGTGKTMLAMAVAQESGANLVTVNGPEIFSKWLGQSEEAVRHVFQMARQSAPTVVLLDQLDAIAPIRTAEMANFATERVVNQLLIELDGIRSAAHIAVVGVTNRADLIDPALLRPGRLGLQLRVGLPDLAAREEILRIHLRALLERDGAGSDLEATLASAATETDGLPGSDLAALCDQARMLALRESGYRRHAQVAGRHLTAAVEIVKRNSAAATDQRRPPGDAPENAPGNAPRDAAGGETP